MQYDIQKTKTRPMLDGDWDGDAWRHAETADIKHFHSRSSNHHPVTQVKFLYDDAGLHAIFRVKDRYVRSVHTRLQSGVCRDSCVEAFLQPKAGGGYLNFEINCGGTLLCYYVEDPRHLPHKKGFAKWTRIPEAMLRKVKIYHSMPRVVRQEITEPVEWRIQFFAPNEVFEEYVGDLGPPAERQWRGNFYKCGDHTSHPHWGSWNPIGPRLNFHQPDFFAPIRFANAPQSSAKLTLTRKPAIRRAPRLQAV
jgi:hypothetical protein